MKRLALLLFLLPVFFLAPKAHAQSSLESCQAGHCYGFGAPTGPAQNGFIFQDVSQSPPALYCSKDSAWVACGGGSLTNSSVLSALNLSPTTNGNTLLFGDSTMYGFAASIYRNSLAGYLVADTTGQAFNYGVVGAFMYQIGEVVNLQVTPVNGTGVAAKIFSNGGINDAGTYGDDAQSINNYLLELNAAIAWSTLPTVNKTMASTATQAGSWAADTTFPINAAFSGTAMTSTTSASTLSASLTVTGTKIGIEWIDPATVSGGTFTVSVDGVNQTFLCSGTTTFTSASCSTTAHGGINREDFPVTPGTHTILVTVTSATSASNVVTIQNFDFTPINSAGQNLYMMSGVIRQAADASSAATTAFDAAAQSVVSALAAENMNVYFVNVRTGIPGVNTDTDFAFSSLCNMSGSSPLHPNDCGYLHWAQTWENAASAAGLSIFVPGVGGNGKFGVFDMMDENPVTTNTRYESTDGIQGPGTSIFWNTNKNNQNNTTYFPPGILYYNASNGIDAMTFTFDPVREAFISGWMSTFAHELMHCIANPQTTADCTSIAYWDPTTGNQTNKGSIQIGSTTAGTCSATVAGEFQYTQGNSSTKDTVQVCAHDASNAYAWRAIY